MSPPAGGIERLMHHVDVRLEQLGLTKTDLTRRGGPESSTLHKIRDRTGQNTPRVSTLLRLDRCLGWEPGSSAAVQLGGKPLTVTARAAIGEALTPRAVLDRLLSQLRAEVDASRADAGALLVRLDRLDVRLDHLANEFGVEEDLLQQFSSDDASSATGS